MQAETFSTLQQPQWQEGNNGGSPGSVSALYSLLLAADTDSMRKQEAWTERETRLAHSAGSPAEQGKTLVDLLAGRAVSCDRPVTKCQIPH